MFDALSTLIDPLAAMLPLWVLLSLRVGVALAAMPAPFGDVAPVRSRVVLGLLVSVALTFPHPELANELVLDPYWLAKAALGEVLVGSVIGLTVRVTIAAVEAAGAFAGFSAGLAFAQSVDPTFGESNTPPARALSALAVLLFFSLQGHHAALAALRQTLLYAPPGSAFAAISADGIVRLGANIVAQGLRIAAPVVATMFLV
ncbi:MAG: flagellar biosynthetic protein FliR, partial [Myxococcota bacterium]